MGRKNAAGRDKKYHRFIPGDITISLIDEKNLH